MEAYHISGGRPLRGSIAIHGAKNGVLPILADTLVVGGRCTLTNCPEIRDVDTALQILRHLGCKAERSVSAPSSTVIFFIPAKILRIRFAAVGAHEPFSTSATVRFCRLCAARSCSSASMETKIPALYVVEAKTR